MSDSKKGQISIVSDRKVRLSDAEVAQLLQKAGQLYEESMRVADLSDISKF